VVLGTILTVKMKWHLLRQTLFASTYRVSEIDTRAQFHQRSTYSFDARGAQKRKKDSQVISLFMLSGSTSVKAERKYVGEIEPWG